MGIEPEDNGQIAKTRKFLIVFDDSPECKIALGYACRRARKTNGIVVLLRIVEPLASAPWMAIGKLMRAEALDDAEDLLQAQVPEVWEKSGQRPERIVREGNKAEVVLGLLDEDPSISVVVLGASTDSAGPGPLVTLLTARSGNLKIPVTLVPGNLSEEELDRLA